MPTFIQWHLGLAWYFSTVLVHINPERDRTSKDGCFLLCRYNQWLMFIHRIDHSSGTDTPHPDFNRYYSFLYGISYIISQNTCLILMSHWVCQYKTVVHGHCIQRGVGSYWCWKAPHHLWLCILKLHLHDKSAYYTHTLDRLTCSWHVCC